jgi:hypothetical protein
VAKKNLYEDGHRYYTNPVKSIRELCVECNASPKFSKAFEDCVAGQDGAVRCPVYPYRFGTNPFRTQKVLTTEQREKAAAALAKARDNSG